MSEKTGKRTDNQLEEIYPHLLQLHLRNIEVIKRIRSDFSLIGKYSMEHESAYNNQSAGVYLMVNAGVGHIVYSLYCAPLHKEYLKVVTTTLYYHTLHFIKVSYRIE